MNQLDIFRCARILMDRDGDDAPIHAAMRADELDAAGDEAGRRVWVAIIAAIGELSRFERRRSESLQ